MPARIQQLERADLDDRQTRIHDAIVETRGDINGPFRVWLNSPEFADRAQKLGELVRYHTKLDTRLTELVILATAREVRSQYEWSAHEPAGERAGLEPEIIDLVRRRADLATVGEVPGLGDRERTIIDFVREVVTEEKVTSATFSRARDLFGEQGVMELAGLVGYYGFINITLKTFDVQLAPGRERLLPDLW